MLNWNRRNQMHLALGSSEWHKLDKFLFMDISREWIKEDINTGWQEKKYLSRVAKK